MKGKQRSIPRPSSLPISLYPHWIENSGQYFVFPWDPLKHWWALPWSPAKASQLLTYEHSTVQVLKLALPQVRSEYLPWPLPSCISPSDQRRNAYRLIYLQKWCWEHTVTCTVMSKQSPDKSSSVLLRLRFKFIFIVTKPKSTVRQILLCRMSISSLTVMLQRHDW